MGPDLINKNIGTIDFAEYFAFPVGDVSGNYSPFYFDLNTATAGANPSVSLNVDNFRNTNLRSDAPHIRRFWTLTPTDLTGTIDYDIAFNYVPADVEDDDARLVPIKFSVDLDTAGYTSTVDYDVDVAEDSIFWSGLTSFSEITAGLDEDNSVTLPVEMLYVRASTIDKDVLIEWATASETNNDYFAVEKSQDLTYFENVAFIDGAGNSSVTREYKMIDPNPYPGISYYRIRQTDFDGQTTVSELVSIELDAASLAEVESKIYPVPFKLGRGLNLSISNLTPGEELVVQVYALDGKQVLRQSFFAKSNSRIREKIFMPPGTSRGDYILTMNYDGVMKTVRIVVK